jgi:hypothetical protein
MNSRNGHACQHPATCLWPLLQICFHAHSKSMISNKFTW